jgi:hypothetical protein
MPFPTLGEPLPRVADAYASVDKWDGWILAGHGHGVEWTRVFAATACDRELVWSAIAQAVTDVPVSTIRERVPYGVIAGVELTLTINARTASVQTAWHYLDEDAAPRLVTAYPTP